MKLAEMQGEKQGAKEEEEEEDEIGFEEMGLDPRLLRAIAKRKLLKPTPIQTKAIPLILVSFLRNWGVDASWQLE